MKKLEKIDEYIFQTLLSELLETIPEYKDFFDENYSKEEQPEVGVYLFMNEFAARLSEEIVRGSSRSNFVVNAFVFINKVGESNNLELLNIVRVGILEILYSSVGIDRNLVRMNLSERLTYVFNEFSKYYN